MQAPEAGLAEGVHVPAVKQLEEHGHIVVVNALGLEEELWEGGGNTGQQQHKSRGRQRGRGERDQPNIDSKHRVREEGGHTRAGGRHRQWCTRTAQHWTPNLHEPCSPLRTGRARGSTPPGREGEATTHPPQDPRHFYSQRVAAARGTTTAAHLPPQPPGPHARARQHTHTHM